MNLTFHWPQITVVVFWVLRLLIHASKNGEPYDPSFKYNFGLALMWVLIYATLLYCGGFFSQP